MWTRKQPLDPDDPYDIDRSVEHLLARRRRSGVVPKLGPEVVAPGATRVKSSGRHAIRYHGWSTRRRHWHQPGTPSSCRLLPCEITWSRSSSLRLIFTRHCRRNWRTSFYAALADHGNRYLVETHSEHLCCASCDAFAMPDGAPEVRPEDVMVLFVEPDGPHSIIREMPLNSSANWSRLGRAGSSIKEILECRWPTTPSHPTYSTSDHEVGRLRLKEIGDVLRTEGLVRDLRVGKWRALVTGDGRTWHRRGKELVIATQGRLISFPPALPAEPVETTAGARSNRPSWS